MESLAALRHSSGCWVLWSYSLWQSYQKSKSSSSLFSDPIVIRFGKKELAGHEDEDNAAATTGDEETGGGNLVTINEGAKDKEHNIPCPSLEFRLVNRLHDVNAGEIGEYIRPCRFNFVCDKFMKYLT